MKINKKQEMRIRKIVAIELILILVAIGIFFGVKKAGEKEILGLAIRDGSIVNTGNMILEISEEENGIITGKAVLEPEQKREINVTENKTYVGRKDE